MPAPAPLPALVDTLAASGGSPRLTAYDADGERVELSGAVLANWVAKTTNLLVEELDVAPGSTVRLDLPAHWRTLVWAMATWRAGGCVVLGQQDGTDVVVTDRPEPGVADAVVAVALPALARRFDGTLPPGAVDAAAAVMTYGDVVGWTPATDPAAPAVRAGVAVGPQTAGDAEVTEVDHAALAGWATAGTTSAPGDRVLLAADPDRATVPRWLRTALGVLLGGGSLVLVGPALAVELATDPARRDRLVATERVTAGA
ncbi:TIGR03089 family protein [uncultured Cellulomonas sp.]|uniref:TIGR03089 family protein n=1 Tax=uncultured Cellulomonas sp. TaxID=189682 RepID=UPI0026196357|nr:TIGR03089 family protein [uncultured Cellulomonas sp.]